MVNACGMGFVGAEVSNGLGRHRFYLPAKSYLKFLKYDYLDWAQVFATLALSKISICLFLLRLSSFRQLRLWLYGLIIFLVTSHVPFLFLMLFQCSPARKYWTNPLEGPGACFSKATVETIIIVQGGEHFTLSFYSSFVAKLPWMELIVRLRKSFALFFRVSLFGRLERLVYGVLNIVRYIVPYQYFNLPPPAHDKYQKANPVDQCFPS